MLTIELLQSPADFFQLSVDLNQDFVFCMYSRTQREPKLLPEVFRERWGCCQHASQVTRSLEIPPPSKVLECALVVLR